MAEESHSGDDIWPRSEWQSREDLESAVFPVAKTVSTKAWDGIESGMLQKGRSPYYGLLMVMVSWRVGLGDEKSMTRSLKFMQTR